MALRGSHEKTVKTRERRIEQLDRETNRISESRGFLLKQSWVHDGYNIEEIGTQNQAQIKDVTSKQSFENN